MSAAIKVEIQQLPHGKGLALPAYQSALAAGLDLLAAVPEDAPIVLAPGKHALVPTGLVIALPQGFEAQVRPRSGLAAKHGESGGQHRHFLAVEIEECRQRLFQQLQIGGAGRRARRPNAHGNANDAVAHQRCAR